MSKYFAITAGVILVFSVLSAAEARMQPYMGRPGESPQLVKCKQEAQYLGAGGKAYDVQAENNRQMRIEYVKKCMHGQ